MPDGYVERRKEPLVCERQDNQVTATPKVLCGSIQFFLVVFDVLQDVKIRSCIYSHLHLR